MFARTMIVALFVAQALGAVAIAGTLPAPRTAPRVELGLIRALRGDTTGAERLFREIYARDSRNAAALANLGTLALLRGEPRVALALYDRALGADSTDAGIYLNRGHASLILADTAAARLDYQRGVEMAGGQAGAARLLGLPAGWDAQKSAEASAALLRGKRGPLRAPDVYRFLSQVRQQSPRKMAPADSTGRSAAVPDSTRRTGPKAAGDQDEPIAMLPLYWKH